VPSDLAFWLAVAATVVAATAAFVSYAVYRSQADPDVIVSAEADAQRSTVINLVIENIGRSPARDINFSPWSPLPAKAWGVAVDTSNETVPMTDGPLIRGIRGKHFGVPWPTHLKSSCYVEVCSFEANDASDRNFAKQIADNLKALSTTLNKVVRDD
jgi:hypothetical protein